MREITTATPASTACNWYEVTTTLRTHLYNNAVDYFRRRRVVRLYFASTPRCEQASNPLRVSRGARLSFPPPLPPPIPPPSFPPSLPVSPPPPPPPLLPPLSPPFPPRPHPRSRVLEKTDGRRFEGCSSGAGAEVKQDGNRLQTIAANAPAAKIYQSTTNNAVRKTHGARLKANRRVIAPSCSKRWSLPPCWPGLGKQTRCGRGQVADI